MERICVCKWHCDRINLEHVVFASNWILRTCPRAHYKYTSQSHLQILYMIIIIISEAAELSMYLVLVVVLLRLSIVVCWFCNALHKQRTDCMLSRLAVRETLNATNIIIFSLSLCVHHPFARWGGKVLNRRQWYSAVGGGVTIPLFCTSISITGCDSYVILYQQPTVNKNSRPIKMQYLFIASVAARV